MISQVFWLCGVYGSGFTGEICLGGEKTWHKMSDVKDKSIISIVISYNDIRNTYTTVLSLLNQTMRTKVVVWDNASSDGTCQILRDHFGQSIIVHESPENIFWSPAINKSLELYYSGEDVIHYSNNDIFYPDESLERMINDLYNTKAGAVGPTGSGIGGLQDYASHQYPLDGHFDNFEDLYEHLKYKRPTRTSSLIGACMVIDSKVWKKIGPLENGTPLGADDFDYSIRLKEAGYELYVCEKAYIHHVSHASGEVGAEHWNSVSSKSWEFFNKKWFGYFFNDEEAIKCLWGHEYHPGWDIGTGWMNDEDRKKVWDSRGITL